MDYYSILGVPKTASDKDIRKAYKKKSMQHHPDRGGDEEQFKQINEAYQTLNDPHKKAMYDHSQTAGQGGFHFNSGHFRNGNPFDDMHVGDMFGFGRTPRNKDIVIAADIDLKDVITGKSVIIQYRLQDGQLQTVTVEIPPGAKHGDTVRYEGLGDTGHPRYPRGNLHVRIRVNKPKNWDRDGNNLITKKIINVFDLMTGCAIIVSTLDNKQVQLKIPPGTKLGQVFSISGYGVPDLNTRQRGNLYVSIEADMPVINDKDTIEEIEKIKKKVNRK